MSLFIQFCRNFCVAGMFAGAGILVPGAERGTENPPAATGHGARSFVETSSAQGEVATSTVGDSLPVYVVPYEQQRSPWPPDEVRFEHEQRLREWMEHPVEPQPIYFPPAPPVLGAPLPGVGLYSDEIVRALAPFIGEPFYAPLSSRLAEEDLGRRVRARLEAYHNDKLALLTELRATLADARLQPAAARRRMLADLALVQAPELEALERTADELRREFFRPRFLGGGGDWSQFRAWRLDPADPTGDRPERRLREMRVLRAAVYYQEGLSPEQRRLLREVVMEQAAALHVPGGGLGPSPDDLPVRVIFFSPETSRLSLPPGLPPALEALIAEYTASKDALKQELRDRLVRLDADRNATRRARSLQDLAGEQMVRVADLENLADRIREHVAPLLPVQDPVPPPALPGALEGRVAAYLREKSELQRIVQEQVAAALAVFDDAEHPAAGTPRRPQRRADMVRSTAEAFHAAHAEKIAALRAEAEVIRDELARHASTRPRAKTDQSADGLLREFAEAFKRQQLASLYSEYRTALLEPGLSLAQRRLLFDAAIADLRLPGAIRDRQVPASETWSRP